MPEFGKEVVLSSSCPFLLAKLLLTCLGKGKRFFGFFKQQFLEAFPFPFIITSFFCSYLPLEPFDLKKFV